MFSELLCDKKVKTPQNQVFDNRGVGISDVEISFQEIGDEFVLDLKKKFKCDVIETLLLEEEPE